MVRFTKDQLDFAASKKGYMGRDESIEFLKTMTIRHSVGHWSAGDFYDLERLWRTAKKIETADLIAKPRKRAAAKKKAVVRKRA